MELKELNERYKVPERTIRVVALKLWLAARSCKAASAMRAPWKYQLTVLPQISLLELVALAL